MRVILCALCALCEFDECAQSKSRVREIGPRRGWGNKGTGKVAQAVMSGLRRWVEGVARYARAERGVWAAMS